MGRRLGSLPRRALIAITWAGLEPLACSLVHERSLRFQLWKRR